jgi:ribosomal protein S4
MSQLSVSSIELDNNVRIICRSIGPLRAEERREKVMHYLEKKRNRKWNKRINYTTRKQVADIRPRFKGRFVTTEQFDEYQEKERIKKERKLRQKVFKIEKIVKPLNLTLDKTN